MNPPAQCLKTILGGSYDPFISRWDDVINFQNTCPYGTVTFETLSAVWRPKASSIQSRGPDIGPDSCIILDDPGDMSWQWNYTFHGNLKLDAAVYPYSFQLGNVEYATVHLSSGVTNYESAVHITSIAMGGGVTIGGFWMGGGNVSNWTHENSTNHTEWWCCWPPYSKEDCEVPPWEQPVSDAYLRNASESLYGLGFLFRGAPFAGVTVAGQGDYDAIWQGKLQVRKLCFEFYRSCKRPR